MTRTIKRIGIPCGLCGTHGRLYYFEKKLVKDRFPNIHFTPISRFTIPLCTQCRHALSLIATIKP